MGQFYENRNHGVVAIITAAHAAMWEVVTRTNEDPFAHGVKIFTFVSKERLERERKLMGRKIFTGSYEDMEKLLAGRKPELYTKQPNFETGPAWRGFVPLSNQEFWSNPKIIKWPLRVTTDDDERVAFGHALVDLK